MMELPDIMFNMVSKGEIKQAIKCCSRLDLKEEVQNSNKVGDRWSEDPLNNTYLPGVHVTTQQQGMDEIQGKIHQRGKGE